MISNRWKILAAALPIIGTCAMAQPQPGGLGGSFSAWWGSSRLTIPEENLVSYWRPAVDGNLVDLISGYDLTTATSSGGTVSLTSNGLYVAKNGDGGGYAFNQNAVWNTIFSNKVTVAFWFKQTGAIGSSGAVNQGSLFVKSRDNTTIYSWLAVNSSEQIYSEIRYDDRSTRNNFTASGAVSNEWNHLVITFDKSTDKVITYLNNVEIYNLTGNPPLSSLGTSRIEFGLWTTTLTIFSRPFTGYFDEMLIYESALSPSDVSRIYNATNLGKRQ